MADVDYTELSTNKDKFIILDMRSRDEVQGDGQIQGSHCIPFKELEEALELDGSKFQAKYGFPKPDPEAALVTHCLKGGRAKKGSDLLVAKGFKARPYVGSFNDWKEKGGKVDPGKPFVPSNGC